MVEIFGAKTGASLVKGWAGTPESYKQFAPISTLDTVLGTRFNGQRCFIVVDIEGFEFFLLQGAKAFLAREPKPVWMIEICIKEHQPQGTLINPNLYPTFEMFWVNGYAAYTSDERLEKVTPQTVEQICSSGIDTLHTHNFLFLEPGQGLPT